MKYLVWRSYFMMRSGSAGWLLCVKRVPKEKGSSKILFAYVDAFITINISQKTKPLDIITDTDHHTKKRSSL